MQLPALLWAAYGWETPFSFGHFFNQEGLGRCGTSQQSRLSEASLPAGRRGAGVTRKVINHENYDDADEKLLFPPDNDYK